MDAAAVLPVQDRRPRVAVRVQTGPRRLLELVEDGVDLRVGRPVLRRPRDHDRAVLVLELQRVGDGGHHVGVSPEHLDALALAAHRVALADQVAGRLAGRAGAAPQALNVHRRRLGRCG